MEQIKLLFDTKFDYMSDYYKEGRNPRILEEITKYILSRKEDMKEIYVVVPDLTNNYLDALLRALQLKGVKVSVLSIPIEEYRDKMLRTNETKREVAKKIMVSANYEYKLGKKFGFSMLYMKGDTKKSLVLTSSDFGLGEKIKDEILVILEEDVSGFRDLDGLINKIFYDDKSKPKEKVSYGKVITFGYFYKNSNKDLEDLLVRHIARCQNRLIIGSQCLTNGKVLEEILSLMEVNPRIMVNTIGDESWIENKKSIIEAHNNIKSHGIEYFLNDRLNGNFLVVDKKLIIMTNDFSSNNFTYTNETDTKIGLALVLETNEEFEKKVIGLLNESKKI